MNKTNVNVNVNDFSNAVPGDRCFDLLLGECIIEKVTGTLMRIVPPKGLSDVRYVDGKINLFDTMPVTYWKRPEFEIPPPPKKKVKITRWINVYHGTTICEYSYSEVFTTKEAAIKAGIQPIYYIATVPIEFEVEK